MTHDCKRNGTTTLFGAIDVAAGKVISACLINTANKNGSTPQYHRPGNFPQLAIHLIVDSYATHELAKVTAWH